MKKSLCVLVALVLTMGALPIKVSASESNYPEQIQAQGQVVYDRQYAKDTNQSVIDYLNAKNIEVKDDTIIEVLSAYTTISKENHKVLSVKNEIDGTVYQTIIIGISIKSGKYSIVDMPSTLSASASGTYTPAFDHPHIDIFATAMYNVYQVQLTRYY